MARIILGSWMVRYPLGGNLSWGLQQLLGLKDLGHEVFLVEKYVYEDSCFNPARQEMSNDCSYGTQVVSSLLKRFGLENNWCYVAHGEVYHGLSKKKINDVFASSDLYIDSGANHAWMEESEKTPVRIMIDGDPGFTQFKFANQLEEGIALPVYDYYYSNGANLGQANNIIPGLGLNWKPFYSPVKTSLFQHGTAPPSAPFTTIMNWQSYEETDYKGISLGQKDIEFEKFIELPLAVNHSMEIAVAGKEIPEERLRDNGWTLKNAHAITISFDSFRDYINRSGGEFSVCKNGYVVTNSGWFSDKSAAYLASGKPVVLQDTGFSQHLPTGQGLFAVKNVEEAKHAIDQINSDYEFHCNKASAIAKEYLESSKCFGRLLKELGI